MRRVLCDKCGEKYEETLKKMVYPKSEIGEPAEFIRVIKGVARTPHASQRVIYMNDAPHKLDITHYDCDRCGSPIKPGARATCMTIWTENQLAPGLWEHTYIDKEK